MIAALPRPTDHVTSAPEVSCPACPHALAAHDRISLRFCQASAAHGTSRGCACPPG